MFKSLILSGLLVAAPSLQANWPAKYSFDEVECMAMNIYHETHASSLADASAVSDVVLNRMNDARWPNTVCEVIQQAQYTSSGEIKKHKCQFSWYCDGKPDEPINNKAWARSVQMAYNFLNHGKMRGITEGSTHYHAYYVSPRWGTKKDRVVRIGSHYFYRK